MSAERRHNYQFASSSAETLSAEPQGMDAAASKRARIAIEKLKESYLNEWAPATINELDRRLQLARSAPSSAGENLEAAFRLAHDMKGQGATFGFVLISDIGASLCTMASSRADPTDGDLCAMLAHVEAARAVLNQRLDDPECEGAMLVMAKLKARVMGYLH